MEDLSSGRVMSQVAFVCAPFPGRARRLHFPAGKVLDTRSAQKLRARGAAGRTVMQKGFGNLRGDGDADAKRSQNQSRRSKASGPVETDEFLLAFTCNVCETRVARKIKKLAYNEGVVIVECPGCANRHLIADNLDWFYWLTDEQKNKNIEDFARERGQAVVRRTVSADTEGLYEILPESFASGDGAKGKDTGESA